MNNDERIKLLESKVEELQAKIGGVKPWTETSRQIDIDLSNIFQGAIPRGYAIKTAISTILNRTFNNKTVYGMRQNECNEAEKLVNFILDFVRDNKCD
ncbi:hypothetical protein [Metaclostridioides mangenotii]|uniref:hypothetical protein n=1 Tax=Metaclostridioides mangenotii TaxID=1540 RepID=UPI000488400B|nr:hypothetical protein [Clostridioides mangenotii]